MSDRPHFRTSGEDLAQLILVGDADAIAEGRLRKSKVVVEALAIHDDTTGDEPLAAVAGDEPLAKIISINSRQRGKQQ